MNIKETRSTPLGSNPLFIGPRCTRQGTGASPKVTYFRNRKYNLLFSNPLPLWLKSNNISTVDSVSKRILSISYLNAILKYDLISAVIIFLIYICFVSYFFYKRGNKSSHFIGANCNGTNRTCILTTGPSRKGSQIWHQQLPTSTPKTYTPKWVQRIIFYFQNLQNVHIDCTRKESLFLP